MAGGGHAVAQPVFDVINRASGLPSDYINGVYQDRYGFMWFSTDAGLARFDGQRVETFTADDGLPHPFVYSVQEDADGILWAGTFEGVAWFDGSRFHEAGEPIGSRLVSQLIADEKRRLVVLAEGIVARREEGAWRIGEGPSFAALGVRRVAALDGEQLIGVGRGTLTLIEPEGDRFVARQIASGWNGGNPLRIAGGGQGALWIYSPAANALLYRIRIEEDRIVRLDSASISGVRHLIPDPDGGAVLYLDDSEQRPGVYRMDSTLQLHDTPILREQAEAFVYDFEGSLWIGSFGRGAFRLGAEHLRPVTDTPATRIAIAPNGDVWASGDGLWQIDSRTLQVTSRRMTSSFREIHFSDDGGLWVSSGQTLFKTATSWVTPFRTDPGWISGIDVAADTVRMSSYSGGIRRVVGGVDVDTLLGGRGLPTDMVEGLERTSEGLWALTRSHGAFRIQGRRAVRYGRDQGLPSSAVYSVYTASDGTTWFGTDRGVARLARGEDRAVAMGEQLLSGQRVAAFFERDGYVWIVGDRTFYVVAAGEVQSIDGLPILPDDASSINDAVHHRAADRVFLATTSGVVTIELAALPFGMRPRPRIAIRSVQVGEAELPLLGTPMAARTGDIAPGRHRVEVEFAPLSFTGPVRTEVRLNEGEWNRVGDERRVVFPELAAGSYRLEVRAISVSGQISPEVASLEFTIQPYWWQRPEFILIVGLLGLGLLVGVVRYVSQRRLREQVHALEMQRRLHDERERISRDLHDHVGAQLSSLLAGVELARLEQRASGDGAPHIRQPDTPDPLDGVEADARTTMRQLRETIWALHGASVSMEEFAARVRSDLTARRTDLHTQVTCVQGAERALSPVQALNLFRITQEAITNVLKHAQARQLEVRLSHDGETVQVEVLDDGEFRVATEGDGVSGPSGFGMESMRARAEHLGGELVIDTAEGTKVRVRVPAEPADAI